MKKIFVIFLSLILLVLTGCGGFVDSDEGYIIRSIDYKTLADGRTQIIITYEDEEIAPAVFYIPKGQDGNGISGIYQTQSEDGLYTELEIQFTGENVEPYFTRIPNGVSVTGITNKVNSDGNTEITINYSHGKDPETFTVLKGDKGDSGKDGVTLTTYTHITNDDGSQDLEFIYSDGSKYPIHIPAPIQGEKGDTGIGIVGIFTEDTIDDGYYHIYFAMSDGTTTHEVKLQKPKDPNQWMYGESMPPNSKGNNGDYFFDIVANTIYVKANDVWNVVIDFQDDEQTYNVSFELSDGAYLPSGFGYRTNYTIENGSNFAGRGYSVPIPVRDGYTFGGWYLVKYPTVVNGAFTDLTPVFSDLTLYAYWIPQNPEA